MTPTPTLENDGTFKLRLIATRAITKGEEICTRYVPYKGDIFSRRKTLLEKWVRKINFSTVCDTELETNPKICFY